MPDDRVNHILLLPQTNYWGWVGASRDYAVRFAVNITPLPDKAVRFGPPNHVISVVNLPDGYPGFGDVVGWLKAQSPTAKFDVLSASTPDELTPLSSSESSGLRLGTDTIPALTSGPPWCLAHRLSNDYSSVRG
jgi:hypothetical protein